MAKRALRAEEGSDSVDEAATVVASMRSSNHLVVPGRRGGHTSTSLLDSGRRQTASMLGLEGWGPWP